MKKSVLHLLVILFIITHVQAQAGGSTAFVHQGVQKKFIDIFVDGQKGNAFGVSAEAESYIKLCCQNRESAIQLLQKNGFKIAIISDQKEVAELNAHWKIVETPYEEFVSANRGTSIKRFWDIFTSYEVILFIRNNQVEHVWARIDRTIP